MLEDISYVAKEYAALMPILKQKQNQKPDLSVLGTKILDKYNKSCFFTEEISQSLPLCNSLEAKKNEN